MKTFTYFAYGSNMLTEWLTDRCPTAQAIGIANAAGYILEFCKPSIDKSGKATLISSKRIEDEVIGALFEIDNGDRCALDKAEGKGKGYNRCDKFSVTVLPDRKQAQVTTYIASACAVNDSLKPYDWYLALVIQGAIQHELCEAYITSLRKFASIPDPKPNRKKRKKAVEDLKHAGVQDFTQVLKSTHTR